MTAHEYLNRSIRLLDVIKLKQDRIRQWREVAKSITVSIDNVGKGPNVSNKIETCVLNIVTLEQEILDEILRLTAVELETSQALSKLTNPQYREVLERLYLKHESFGDAADAMRYSYRWFQTLHKRALKQFEKESM